MEAVHRIRNPGLPGTTRKATLMWGDRTPLSEGAEEGENSQSYTAFMGCANRASGCEKRGPFLWIRPQAA